jgi:hypothetical protein
MAISTQVNNDLYKRALSEAEKERLAAIAKQQGAGAASSLALQMANAQNTTTPTPKVATAPANTVGAVGSTNTNLAAQQAQAAIAAQQAAAVNNASNKQDTTNKPVSATQPVQMQDYLIFGTQDPNFKLGMSDADRNSWNAIGQKYAAGDTSWNKDTNTFRENGNWSGYYDDNGGYNGWLRAVDGTGGYAPAFGGKIGETGYKEGTVFYAPDGTAYTMGADGSLTKSGNVTLAKYGSSIGPKAGYQDSDFWVLEDGQYKKYTNQTAPDSVLESQGYYRDANGLVLPIDDQYRMAQAVKNGDITVEQAALAQAVASRNAGNIPTVQPTAQNTQPVQSAQPIRNTPQYTQAPQTTQPSQQAKPLPQDQQVQTQTVSRIDPTAFQAYLDQWSYGPAPEWTGGQDESWRDIYNYDYGEAPTWEGSQYDRMRDDALAAYGEKWQGSEYQKQRDEALRRAQDMRFNYDPNTDANWQALQKQYRREGDRATQEALAQAAMRTGGLANSYAVTAATQAGDYYAAQLSDRLPQLYQDAYQRYLQEFQRQMGISDQYAGFDDREYARWADQQGKNLDLADRYNQYGQQEYGQYQDRLGQFNTDRNFQYGLNRDYVSDAERANQTAYSRYLDSLDQYNRDRAMSYEQFRDAVGDMRYDDETQYARRYQAQRDAIEDQRYDQQWAQQLREYADSQNWKAADWAQYLREYEDKMSWQEREWAYQQYRDAVGDDRWEREYADQRSDTMYERALYDQEYADQRGDKEWEKNYKQTTYNDALEDAALDYLNKNGIVTGRYAEILGVPDGTTYEQYYSRYLGGGSSSPFDETEIPSGTTPTYTPPPDDGGGNELDLSKVGNRASRDWVALDDNQRVSWQELYTLVENGDVEEYYQNGKYYYRWKNMKVPEGKPKETTPKVVYENRGGR